MVRPTTREAPPKDRSARGASEGTRFVCRDPRRALFLSLTEPLPRCLIPCDNSGRAVQRSGPSSRSERGRGTLARDEPSPIVYPVAVP